MAGRRRGSGPGARVPPPSAEECRGSGFPAGPACRPLPGKARLLSRRRLGPDARAPPESQWDRWVPEHSPVAPGPRADQMEALPFPRGRQNRGGRSGGAGRCALPPHLPSRVTRTPFHSPLQGIILLSCPAPGFPPSSAPGPERCSAQNRSPLPSPSSSPFPLHPHLPHFFFFISLQEGFSRPGRKGVQKEGRYPSKPEAPAQQGGNLRAHLLSL